MPDILQVSKKSTIRDLEDLTAHLTTNQSGSVDVWLPRELGTQFFKENRVTSLLAMAARDQTLYVTDWIGDADIAQTRARFGTRIEGLASLTYAAEIRNARKERPDIGEQELKRVVIEERGGIAEPEPHEDSRKAEAPGGPKRRGEGSRAHSLTFCAFDHQDPRQDAPIPIALSAVNTKEAFIQQFIKYRHKYFEKGRAEDYGKRVSRDSDRALASFVYELFENSYQHGRLNYSHELIKGIRYVCLRKHIDYNKTAFIKRAASFPELQKYLHQTISKSGTFIFYEVSVSDHGLGIIDRFLATRPEFRSGTIIPNLNARISLLNRIIREALSSKYQTGAGHGLRRALAAVDTLQGFLSLRTDRLWVHHTSANASSRDATPQLIPVGVSENLPLVAGTHFNMLFPLT